MAIKVLPNETVKFSPTGQDFNTFNKDCMHDNELWCQLAEPQVITQFEGELTPLTGTNLLTNPDFDTDLTGWTATSGFWEWVGPLYGRTFPGTQQANIRQTYALTDGKLYRIGVQVIVANNAELLISVVGGGGIY